MKYRAECRFDHWQVYALMPAINGLSTWVVIADCGKSEPEDQEIIIGAAFHRDSDRLRPGPGAWDDILMVSFLIGDMP